MERDAVATLSGNRPSWDVRLGDVTSTETWIASSYEGVDLLAAGVPCPPFSVAGQQLGRMDERDLFAWTVELVAEVRPRGLILENVRGLSMPRFAGYRQHIQDRLAELGYWSQWRLLHASDYGVPQLRPRFVLVGLPLDEASYFQWPQPRELEITVGTLLEDLMSSGGWAGAKSWANGASGVAPTIVGGSRKHGGADLGPTRAKAAWRRLGVDAMGIADAPPSSSDPIAFQPRLTHDMVARVQGWLPSREYQWRFEGGKTSKHRQVGNAFPPPVARAVGEAMRCALQKKGIPQRDPERDLAAIHDPVLMTLQRSARPLSARQLANRTSLSISEVQANLGHLEKDFELVTTRGPRVDRFQLAGLRTRPIGFGAQSTGPVDSS
jgi:DNA (cytosine-5)-methyltransferase 1